MKISLSFKILIVFLLFLLCNSHGFSQIEIASQRFHNGNPGYQSLVADQNSNASITTHIGTDNWNYIATSTNGQIRVVNTNVSPNVSPDYCLELKNYWDNNLTLDFEVIDITNFNDVSFSVYYRSTGSPDDNEDLYLDYSYSNNGGSTWVDTTVKLIDGVTDITDAVEFGVAGTQSNPYELGVGVIPNTANAFKATIRAAFEDGSNGQDEYFIDDVILSGIANTLPPVAQCNSDFDITLDAFGNAAITADDIDDGSYIQNSGTMLTSIDVTEFNCSNLGPNLVTLSVNDGTQTITCTTTVTVNAYSGAMVAPTLPSITTYCSYIAEPPSDINYQCNVISPTTTDATTFTTNGLYSIDWLYYDAISGNSVTATQNISLVNLSAPTGLTITNIGPDVATISWDAQIGVSSYEVEYKKNSLVNWDSFTTITNTLDLILLEQLTMYDIRVIAKCDSGSSVTSSTENFTTVGYDYCEPTVPNFNPENYIRRVRFGNLAQNIDNTSTYTNGYDDYTATDSANLYKDVTYTLTIDRYSRWYFDMGYAVWIDFNSDGDFDDAGEYVWQFQDDNFTTNNDTVTANILIPSYANSGATVMRVATRAYWTPTDPCDGNFDGQRGEVEDYTLNIEINPNSPQEIDVTGNGNIIIDEAGFGELSEDNNTNFGIHDIFDGVSEKTFRITNNGGDPLELIGIPLVQFMSVTTDFTIVQPTISILEIGESTNFKIIFDPTSEGIKSATLQILNDDIDIGDSENDYTFYIQGEGVELFPDTDGDGVPDNIDGDDDNDGILDATEDAACRSYSYSQQVETVFLNETFGSGYNRITVNQGTTGSSTTYCFEDGTGSCGGGNDLNDGAYAIYYQASNGDGNNQTPNGDLAFWADRDWYSGLDHTPDSIDGAEPGRMLVVNASHDPGIFYEATIVGVAPGVEVTYGFSVINLIKTSAPGAGGKIKPDVGIAVYDPNGIQIAFDNSGLIEPTDSSNSNGDWVNLETTFISSSSQFTIQLINNQSGGDGNDLAIDDIYVKQILCDQDGDGVSDLIDLDNDNDGIPNVVELQLADGDKDATLFGDGWVDTNANGVHDLYESGAPLIDTDGDGIPDYIDADSDNDGIFDTVEYDGLGDIDVDGDGKGDGSDIDSLILDDEADGDGLLAIIDGNDSDLDNTDHGSAAYATPLDSDNDGIPDYLEVDSNNDGVYDIEETIYLAYDSDDNGIIDDVDDVDQDGIIDSFDTNTTVFGSPRQLDDSYTLYFDGRNDYISENLPVIDGWSSSTLMAWIKIAPDASGKMRIAGQDNFYLAVNIDGTASAIVGGNVKTSTTVLPINIWVHVAASFNNADGNFVLYVNGEQEDVDNASSIPAAISDFTIGRMPGVLGEENVLTSEYFKGEIDEVRLFNAGLSEDEIQKMVYQELDDTNGFENGKIIPSDISVIAGSSLQRYYKMDKFDADITSEKKGVSVGAKLYNIKDVYFQTAPLPFVTKASGSWTSKSTWLYGDVWDIDETSKNKDWSIVKIEHDITASHDIKTLGLLIDSDKTLNVQGDHLVQNSWYLELNGTLDLEDDSQLVQTEFSDLVSSAEGKILRRQEGTSSPYWYNYWSSPVGATGATSLINNNATTANPNNSAFSLNMLKDESGFDMQFISGYTGSGNISTYWLYSFKNGITYWDWDRVSTTTPLQPGVGYTQKGTGTTAPEQQYIFEGKPNNGTILIDVADVGGTGSVANVSKTSYLLGNPYASAIDVYKFIDDNVGVIDGYLYLWQQWSGTSHNLSEYQGGYAKVNKMGSIRARQFLGLSGETTGGIVGTLKPTRYLPVGQGFLTEIIADGQIEFNNSQRVFIKESDADGSVDTGSVFSKAEKGKSSEETSSKNNGTTDVMQKIRLEFSSTSGPETRNELLLGFSNYTTDGYDYGYDAKNTELNNNDLNLDFEGVNMNIQAYSSITDDKVVALNFSSSGDNAFEIKISGLDNVEDDQAIYLRDNLTGTYFDLTQDIAYGFSSDQGIFNERFELVFQSEQETLSTEVSAITENYIYFQNNTNTLFVKKLTGDVSKLSLVNMRGQVVLEMANVSKEKLDSGIQFNRMSTGAYVVYMRTDTNEVLTKKVIIK